METRKPRARSNVQRFVEDMALRGWNNADLARAADVAVNTVSRFMRGEIQTAKTANKLAIALGASVKRYLITAQSRERVSA
jgi:transcriptional regulator with XRE-family HTH domain